MKELRSIQRDLKAPKWQKNTFWNYKYRSCEDILEAVKPLLSELECVITLSDAVENIGNYNYIKATATITWEKESFSVTAYAREADTKKWMDSSQITWATSSYARKYALNWLFAIDDTKDADSMNNDDGKKASEWYEKKTHSDELDVPKKELPWFNDNHLKAAIEASKNWTEIKLENIKKKYRVASRYDDDLAEICS